MLTRRSWLQSTTLAGLSTLTALLQRGRASAARGSWAGFGKARSVLIVFAGGGQSQLEMWDPKPNAPVEVRGAFGTIPTAIPGVRFGEHLPRVARLADRFTVLRTVSHDDLDHGSAIYQSLTGQPHPKKSSNPPPQPHDAPTHGAVLHRVRPDKQLPHTAVHVNGPVGIPEFASPGQFAGLLGRAHDPLILGDVSGEAVLLPGTSPVDELNADRRTERRGLLERLEKGAGLAQANAGRDMGVLYDKAFELLDSPRYQAAFDLSQEPARLRDRYGRNRSGQACLLGRRLIEAGVPLVTVMHNHSIRGQDKAPDVTEQYGWDTHNDIFDALKNHLLPRFDLSFSALLEDMEQRGLLDKTLVVCMGEFGRAPLVALERTFAGTSPGRKHWGACYSVVFAGAGVTRGAIVGASDRSAGYPQTTPYGPWDVAATLFSALGIDPNSHYADANGRIYPVTIGQPIGALYQG